ncbi:MAG TPA: TIGR03621 family F420-dependent LLM class oxidoreductase [Burkholderiales bacterium]|nr:TIGR03621 family F420-dependent LLM class oxidoreductase [Burkholderiales bacterium]
MAHQRKFRFAIQHTHAPSGQEWLDMARRAEDSGVDVFSLPDHLGDQFAPMPALAAAAAVTSKIRFSMFVLNNDNRHPGMLAKEAATLDLISNGRLELGVGAGWTRAEYDALGMRFDKPSVRIARLAESVKILRGVFTSDSFSFSGEHYSITDLAIRPRPVQKAGIPILLGGGGKKMLTLAAQAADIVSVAANNSQRPSMTSPLSGFALKDVAEQYAWVREAAGGRFDDIEINARVLAVSVGPDRDAQVRKLAAELNLPAEDLQDSPFALVGTLEQIEGQLRALRDRFGVSYFTFSYRHSTPLLPLIGRLAGR